MEKPATAMEEKRRTDQILDALSIFVTELNRLAAEIRDLDADFQQRLEKAVRDTEAALQSRSTEKLERALEETRETVRKQITQDLRSQFYVELETQLVTVRTQVEQEAKKAAAQWEAERNRLKGEIEKARQEFETAAAQWEAERAALKEQVGAQAQQSPAPASGGNSAEIRREITRIETLIHSMSAVIDDPATDLSTVIRKNVQRAEFESYLNGIRFAIGQAEPHK